MVFDIFNYFVKAFKVFLRILRRGLFRREVGSKLVVDRINYRKVVVNVVFVAAAVCFYNFGNKPFKVVVSAFVVVVAGISLEVKPASVSKLIGVYL